MQPQQWPPDADKPRRIKSQLSSWKLSEGDGRPQKAPTWAEGSQPSQRRCYVQVWPLHGYISGKHARASFSLTKNFRLPRVERSITWRGLRWFATPSTRSGTYWRSMLTISTHQSSRRRKESPFSGLKSFPCPFIFEKCYNCRLEVMDDDGEGKVDPLVAGVYRLDQLVSVFF